MPDLFSANMSAEMMYRFVLESVLADHVKQLSAFDRATNMLSSSKLLTYSYYY